MATITIMDPVTRIEGHMKVKVEIGELNGQKRVVDTYCSGTLFRGFEQLLEGRDPWDAPVITQRICGVCPISHGQASVLALENVAGWHPPTNGRLLRNLTLGANFIQSHILHFYLLAAMDYVKGPIDGPPWTPAWDVDMRGGLDAIVDNTVLAIEARRRAHEMGAIFGGKMPTSHSFIPGGFTATPTQDRIDSCRAHLDWLINFIENSYINDVNDLAAVYGDYLNIGAGCKNLLAYGVFELDDIGQEKLLKAGYVEDGGIEPSKGFSGQDITEFVKYSWYDDETSNLSPSSGETQPAYPKGEAYSWLKAPRMYSKPFEVGPLARMWITGDYRDGMSVMHRHMARAKETLKIAQTMLGWLNELDNGSTVWEEPPMPGQGFGIGLTEAPRGALGHWVRVTGGRIAHYQVITPTCWNASPRDDQSVLGPMEQALIGTPIQDESRPIEALRVIHSFDPCLSCAVHVMRPNKSPIVLKAGMK